MVVLQHEYTSTGVVLQHHNSTGVVLQHYNSTGVVLQHYNSTGGYYNMNTPVLVLYYNITTVLGNTTPVLL
jgi:hypothetical protein